MTAASPFRKREFEGANHLPTVDTGDFYRRASRASYLLVASCGRAVLVTTNCRPSVGRDDPIAPGIPCGRAVLVTITCRPLVERAASVFIGVTISNNT